MYRVGTGPTFVSKVNNKLTDALAFVLDTALLKWLSEYAALAYTTQDSTVSYLNYTQITQTSLSFALRRTTAGENIVKTVPRVWFIRMIAH